MRRGRRAPHLLGAPLAFVEDVPQDKHYFGPEQPQRGLESPLHLPFPVRADTAGQRDLWSCFCLHPHCGCSQRWVTVEAGEERDTVMCAWMTAKRGEKDKYLLSLSNQCPPTAPRRWVSDSTIARTGAGSSPPRAWLSFGQAHSRMAGK